MFPRQLVDTCHRFAGGLLVSLWGPEFWQISRWYLVAKKYCKNGVGLRRGRTGMGNGYFRKGGEIGNQRGWCEMDAPWAEPLPVEVVDKRQRSHLVWLQDIGLASFRLYPKSRSTRLGTWTDETGARVLRVILMTLSFREKFEGTHRWMLNSCTEHESCAWRNSVVCLSRVGSSFFCNNATRIAPTELETSDITPR